MNDIEPGIEAMAREMLKIGGHDPDSLVQPGTPQVYQTPGGVVHTVSPGAEQPLWRFYISSARSFLTAARKIQAESLICPENN